MCQFQHLHYNNETKVIIIFNQQKIIRALNSYETSFFDILYGDVVTYSNSVWEGVEDKKHIKFIEKKQNLISWKNAFRYVIKNFAARSKILLTISHSNGIAINANSYTLLCNVLNPSLLNGGLSYHELLSKWKKKKAQLNQSKHAALFKKFVRQSVSKKKILYFKKRAGFEFPPVKGKCIGIGQFMLMKLFDRLLICDLADFLKKEKICFDLLIMNNCYTAIVDNIYNLRQTTKQIFASAVKTPLSFIDTGVLYSSLAVNDFTATFHNLNAAYLKNNPKEAESYNAVLINTDTCEKLLTQLNKLFEQLIDKIKTDRKFADAFTGAIHSKGSNFFITEDKELPYFDLHFLLCFLKDFSPGYFDRCIDSFLDALNSVCIARYENSAKSPGAISIYLPQKEAFLKGTTVFYNYFVSVQNEFVKKSRFSDLLYHLYT